MVMRSAFIDQFSVPVDQKSVKRDLLPFTVIQRFGSNINITVVILTEHSAFFILMNIEILSVECDEVELILI